MPGAAAGEFGIEGVVFVVRVWIIGKPADEDELQIELPEALTEHALFENFELGVHVQMLGEHGLDSLSHSLGVRPSSRIVRVILGQFLPPSYLEPFNDSMARFGSNFCISKNLGCLAASM